MSLGASRYPRALPPVQKVLRGLLLIPYGSSSLFSSLAGAQRHHHAHSHCLWPSSPRSRLSTPRCLLRPSLLARRLTTRDSTPRPETAAKDGETPQTLTEKLASVPVRPHGRESVLIKAATVYPTRRATLAEENKRFVAKRRQQWYLEKRIAKHTRDDTAPTDWRYILRLLSDYTPVFSTDQVSNKTVHIVVPPAANHLLKPRGRDIIQLIGDRTGCKATVHEGEGQNGTDYVSVTGFYTCVEEATEQISQLDSRIMVVSPGGTATVYTSKELVDRRIIALHHRPTFAGGSYDLRVRADEIPHPATWTEESFKDHVQRLVKGRMTAARVSKLYGTSGSHELAVIYTLLELFQTPSMFPLITPEAFHMALAYMARSTHNSSWARRLLQSMISRGFPMDLTTMHLLLEATTKDKNLSDYQTLLEQMIRRQLNPTMWTWILFLRHLRAEDVKRYTLYLMDKKGLLDVPGTMGLVALEMASHDAYRGARLELDAKAFIAEQERLYGPEWAATDTCNKINHELLLHDLDVVLTAQVTGDTVTLNTFLTHALRKRDPRIAIQILKLFYKKEWGSKVIQDESLELLMKLAFRAQQPNMMSVVWRYACMVGESSFWMRRQAFTVMKSESRALKIVGWMSPSDADDQPPNLEPKTPPTQPHPRRTRPPHLRPLPPRLPPPQPKTPPNPIPNKPARLAFVHSIFLTDQDFILTDQDAPDRPCPPSSPAEALAERVAFYRDNVDAFDLLRPLHVMLEEARERDEALRCAVAEGRPLDAALLRLVDVEVYGFGREWMWRVMKGRYFRAGVLCIAT